MIQINDETYITTNQAASLTGYDPGHIQKLAASGAIKAQKVGRSWAISKQSILNYVNKPVKQTTKQRYGQNTGSMTIKAMLLGHKMGKSPDGRVYCSVCQKTVTEITRGQLRCNK